MKQVLIVLCGILAVNGIYNLIDSPYYIKSHCTTKIKTHKGDIYDINLFMANNTSWVQICNKETMKCMNMTITQRNIVENLLNIDLDMTNEEFDEQYKKNINCNTEHIKIPNIPFVKKYLIAYGIASIIILAILFYIK